MYNVKIYDENGYEVYSLQEVSSDLIGKFFDIICNKYVQAMENTPERGKRDEPGLSYSLIPIDALKELADVYQEGLVHYGKNNWKKGLPYTETINHMLCHLFRWMEGDRTELHLAKVAWGAFTLIWHEKHKPEFNDLDK